MGFYLFRKVVFNCNRATQLALKKQDGRASWLERMQLFYHTLYCDPCKRFIKQSEHLNSLLAEVNKRTYDTPLHSLNDDLKKDIQAKIDQLNK